MNLVAGFPGRSVRSHPGRGSIRAIYSGKEGEPAYRCQSPSVSPIPPSSFSPRRFSWDHSRPCTQISESSQIAGFRPPQFPNSRRFKGAQGLKLAPIQSCVYKAGNPSGESSVCFFLHAPSTRKDLLISFGYD